MDRIPPYMDRIPLCRDPDELCMDGIPLCMDTDELYMDQIPPNMDLDERIRLNEDRSVDIFG